MIRYVLKNNDGYLEHNYKPNPIITRRIKTWLNKRIALIDAERLRCEVVEIDFTNIPIDSHPIIMPMDWKHGIEIV